MNERIAVNSNIQFGKPCVAGTRVPMQSVLELVRECIGLNHIIRDYYSALDERTFSLVSCTLLTRWRRTTFT